ncbi:MAG: hypothetical protein Kow001_11360 [Acidobacteriota bacterium]
MPTFVTLYRYTDRGIRDVKNSPARIRATVKAMEAAGGKLIGVWVTMGAYDLVAVSEWPSDEAAAAAALAQGALGNVTSQSMRAFTVDEFQRIVDAMPSLA